MTTEHLGLRLVSKIVALLLTGIFFATAAWSQNLEVSVETSKGRSLSDLPRSGLEIRRMPLRCGARATLRRVNGNETKV